MSTAAFTLEQVIFSLKSQKNLFPKLFRRDAWVHNHQITWLAKNTWAKMSTAAFTLEQVIFSPKSKKNLFPKLCRIFYYFFIQKHRVVVAAHGASADFSKVFLLVLAVRRLFVGYCIIFTSFIRNGNTQINITYG